MKPDNIDSLVADLCGYVRSFVGNRAWEVLACHIEVLDGVTKGKHWLVNKGKKIDDGGFEEGYAEMRAGLAAARALRDEHLRTTGQRIWGLTFTLYPDGKHDIAYDYNKPEDYDDSDDADGSPGSGSVADLLGELVDAPVATNTHTFLRQALQALQSQTAHNSDAWGLGTETQWNLDMNAGTLRFTFADGRVLTAPVQVVGTYNTANGTFLWGWDHPSVPEPLRRAAQRLHDYGRANGLEAFTTRSITCSEPDAWSYTAAAAQLEQAAGAYRGAAGGTWVYMVFEQPTTAA